MFLTKVLGMQNCFIKNFDCLIAVGNSTEQGFSQWADKPEAFWIQLTNTLLQILTKLGREKKEVKITNLHVLSCWFLTGLDLGVQNHVWKLGPFFSIPPTQLPLGTPHGKFCPLAFLGSLNSFGVEGKSTESHWA